jgi:hypothetical protein
MFKRCDYRFESFFQKDVTPVFLYCPVKGKPYDGLIPISEVTQSV